MNRDPHASSFADRLDGVRTGDIAALNDLLERWRPFLQLQARGLLGTRFSARTDSSDVVQETLSRISQDVSDFRGQTEAEWIAWLRSIMFAQVGKMRRFHLAHKRHVGREADSPVSSELGESPDPCSRLVAQERIAKLAQAIEQLSDVMQEVVLRRVFDQQPFEEVARAIKRSNGATRVLWTRAMRQIQAYVETCGDSGSL